MQSINQSFIIQVARTAAARQQVQVPTWVANVAGKKARRKDSVNSQTTIITTTPHSSSSSSSSIAMGRSLPQRLSSERVGTKTLNSK